MSAGKPELEQTAIGQAVLMLVTATCLVNLLLAFLWVTGLLPELKCESRGLCVVPNGARVLGDNTGPELNCYILPTKKEPPRAQ